MNKYYFIYLIWLLPAYFLFQAGYQFVTYQGVQSTFSDGDSYVANVIDFDVKQIAAQTNGYVVLKFSTSDGADIEKQLALPVQMAQVIMDSELIPIRYLENSFNPIVMMPVYELQLSVIKVNLAVTGIGLLATLLVALYASRFARRRIRDGEELFEIERLDPDNID
jgi:hypothetical protein